MSARTKPTRLTLAEVRALERLLAYFNNGCEDESRDMVRTKSLARHALAKLRERLP